MLPCWLITCQGKGLFLVVLFLLLGLWSQKVYSYCRESKHQGLLCMNMCGFPPEPNGAVENFWWYAEPTCKHLWGKSGYLWRNDGAKRWRLCCPLVKHPHKVHKWTVTPYPFTLSWSLLIIFLNNTYICSIIKSLTDPLWTFLRAWWFSKCVLGQAASESITWECIRNAVLGPGLRLTELVALGVGPGNLRTSLLGDFDRP